MSADMAFVQKSKKDLWQTPSRIIDPLQEHIGIDLDPCAGEGTDIGDVNFYPWETDGLEASWDVTGDGDVSAYVNPAFSAKKVWLQKGISEYLAGNVERVVFLTPDSTSVKEWWHGYIVPYSSWTWFARGRVNFYDPTEGKVVKNAPNNSALSIVGSVPEAFESWARGAGDVVYRPRRCE